MVGMVFRSRSTKNKVGPLCLKRNSGVRDGILPLLTPTMLYGLLHKSVIFLMLDR